MSTCRKCSFQTCVDCDAPEHLGEVCEAYQRRIKAAHGADEAATAATYKQCPHCKTCFEVLKGCGYLQCENCKHRFCSRCLIPWVGAGSAYLGGRTQHAPYCTYHIRDTPSVHGIKHRFVEDEEVLETRKKARVAKRARRENEFETEAAGTDMAETDNGDAVKKEDNDDTAVPKPGSEQGKPGSKQDDVESQCKDV